MYVARFQFDRTTGRAAVAEGMRVTAAGGFAPRWRGDGRELFFLSSDGWVMSLPADAKGARLPTTGERLFAVTTVGVEWGVSADRPPLPVCDTYPAVPFAERDHWLADTDSGMNAQ